MVKVHARGVTIENFYSIIHELSRMRLSVQGALTIKSLDPERTLTDFYHFKAFGY